nr:hypothetical protein [Tanacetum cinerariifolium]
IPEEQKQKIEDMMFELVKICQEKEFLCIHDDINDLVERALDSKLLLINSNSQHLEKKEHEVKNVLEQPAERGNCKSNAENLLPIPSKCEVTLEDEIKCNIPAKDVCSLVFTTFSNPLFKDDDNFDSSDDESLPELNGEIVDTIIESIPLPIPVQDGGEIFVSTNNEDVDYFPFMFVIRIFFPYLILSEISPLFLSAESEDTIFDPGISPDDLILSCVGYLSGFQDLDIL